jgi:CheY-like chemotaxis protein
MGNRILVVDDNPINLKLAGDLLESEGFKVQRAGDAEQAMELIGRSRPDLILMDIGLPGMDGLALTRKLKADEATRGITIIAFTSFAMKGDEQRTIEAGCDAYISKPVDAGRLVAQISEMLRS